MTCWCCPHSTKAWRWYSWRLFEIGIDVDGFLGTSADRRRGDGCGAGLERLLGAAATPSAARSATAFGALARLQVGGNGGGRTFRIGAVLGRILCGIVAAVVTVSIGGTAIGCGICSVSVCSIIA
jgi:hypothetical protein